MPRRAVLRDRVRAGWLAVAGAVALGAAEMTSAVPAAIADPKVAEALFKSGKQAYQKGDFSGAVAFFTKALAEDDELAESIWWRASSQEKAGDKAAAVTSYREFLGRVGAKAAPSKEELRLKAPAEKSVDALAAGEKELRKAEDAFVAALLQFAKDNFVRDPGVALKALGHLLDARPDHEEALRLREKLGGPAAPGGAAAKADPARAFKDVKTWKDVIAEQLFRRADIAYQGDVMVFDANDGKLTLSPTYVETGSRYVFETEFRIVEAYARDWLAGFCFGAKNGRTYTVFAMSAQVVLTTSVPSAGSVRELAVWDTTAIDKEAWHRLAVVVRAPTIEVWFDGKRVASWEDKDADDMRGEFGLYQQGCRSERRGFRIGTLD